VNNLVKNHQSKIWWLLWLALFGLALVWRAQNLDAFGPVNDEGAHLMWARLAVQGYPLYSEIQAVQAPLFLETIGLAFRLAGQTVQAGRWAMLAGFGLLAVVLSWLAFRAGGWAAALAAMFLLAVSPLIFTFSRLVMAEVPATGLAVTSLGLCFVYLDRPRRWWLFASGLVLGLSFITKALNPFVAAPVGFLLVTLHFGVGQKFFNRRGWVGILGDCLFWSSGVLLPVIMLPLFYDPVGLYDQLVIFRNDLRVAIPGSWPDTWAEFAIFFRSHWGIWLLAGAGLVTSGWLSYRQLHRAKHGWQNVILSQESPLFYPLTWTVWLLGGVVMLLWHTPLFPHHFVLLLPPLMLLAAGFMADIVALSRRRRWAYGLWVVVVIAALNLPAMFQTNQKSAAIVTGGRETEALQLLAAVAAPTDFVMGDSQLLIFMAGRRTPPPLGDVALVAIKAGRQTSERMTALTAAYQAPAVVQWSLRLPWLPEYLAWVEEHYLGKRVWDNDHIIYFAPRLPVDQPLPNQRDVPLGESLRLRGFQIDDVSGDQLNLKLYWQANTPPAEDYTVFTQLLDNNGAWAAGWDSQPLGGYLPTGQWPTGEIVTDRVQFPLPAALPPGDYTLITGMYLLSSGQRLAQLNGADHIVLTTVTIP
jgi:4-amino-4-deoxy-L-arabinose transferase-like glycosyltransferase